VVNGTKKQHNNEESIADLAGIGGSGSGGRGESLLGLLLLEH